MSPLNDWNNTKLLVQHHHDDLYHLTTPKALLDEPSSPMPERSRPTVMQTVQLVVVALFVAILRR